MLQENSTDAVRSALKDASLQSEFLQTVIRRQSERFGSTMLQDQANIAESVSRVVGGMMANPTPFRMVSAWNRYLVDASERAVLTADAFRRWSDANGDHLENGSPPPLVYDYDLIMDGAHQPKPTNYILLKIRPPAGMSIDNAKRPYIIIDPRAGHGGGIGGFKPDSQVGIALSSGHPVYFVAFRVDPEPGQTLADVCHTEAAFVAEVERLHPKSAKPIVVGNCQAGWATAIMAATHPELTGPIVLNGTPMSYWAGNIGEYPMRYTAGVIGGLALTLMSSDMGAGIYDGANLVYNFEQLNPSRNWFRKYFDLYRDIDHGDERFVDFERWWGAYYLLTDEEIRWIVETLFVGNYLGKNQAQLDLGVPIDLKKIRVPIICFASEGDSITPPAQALNWILDTYADEYEIMSLGQRIVYMVHEKVGHLGIFVSSSIAKKEHKGMASVLELIETLPPGLYEMDIEDENPADDNFVVSLRERTFADLADLTGDRRDEDAFAGVARASEAVAEMYETFARPVFKSMFSNAGAEFMRATHPLRVRKHLFSTGTPVSVGVKSAAERVSEDRHKVEDENPFIQAERLWADMVELQWDMFRDMKEAAAEWTFFSLWTTPWAMAYGRPKTKRRYLEKTERLDVLPKVQDALERLEDGGVAAGIVRIVLELKEKHGGRLELGHVERFASAVRTMAPFKSIPEKRRRELLERQRIIYHVAPDRGLDSIPLLIRTAADRKMAEAVIKYIIGSEKPADKSEAQRAWNDARKIIGAEKVGVEA
ncbi:MAG: DUF3141 domain-containing protein [Pseudomonadota bacterium]